MEKHKKKLSKKRFYINVVFIILMIYLITNIFSTQSKINQRKKELESYNAQIAKLEAELIEAKARANVSEEDFMLNYARDELNYVYPNEKIFIPTP